jgi:hypothetical protein
MKEGFDIHRRSRVRSFLVGKNRKDGYGGVLITISNEYITSQVTELDTNCEIVWATIKSTGNKTLYLGTYCIPPSDKWSFNISSKF